MNLSSGAAAPPFLSPPTEKTTWRILSSCTDRGNPRGDATVGNGEVPHRIGAHITWHLKPRADQTVRIGELPRRNGAHITWTSTWHRKPRGNLRSASIRDPAEVTRQIGANITWHRMPRDDPAKVTRQIGANITWQSTWYREPRTSVCAAAYGGDPAVENAEVPCRIGGRVEICKVDVVSWRERRIKGKVLVAADVDSVWSVLTDYEKLANFIPNLIHSRLIPCPHVGRVWLEQRGLQRALYWCIEARVLLELQEIPCTGNARELVFSMVDGDFKKFEGKWSVKAGPRSSSAVLFYEVNVIPRFNFPAIFIERIIQSDLPVNLQALAWRAESRFMSSQMKHSTESARESEESDSAPTWTASSASRELINSFRKACPLDRPCSVDEVHVRKVHGILENGGTHRCVVASITVKAPVHEVWAILTSYEALPEIVPNLAISKVLLRENNKVRILQEGCKGLLYMVLHARVVLDLCETREEEITFEQVEGDFDSFRGKWMLEQLGVDHTLLKYSVESKLRQDSFLSDAILEEVIYEDLPANLCAIRDYIERRTEGERKRLQVSPVACADRSTDLSSTSSNTTEVAPRQRPKVPGLQRDAEILKAEILAFVSEHGQEGFMPMRKQLRLHGRVDIEKAITRMGGFRKIASLMNLSLAYKLRKPKGYWDDLENLRQEISRFQRSWGMDAAFMPSRKSFERAGRYDIARALEKWGGLQEVARLLSLELRNPRRPADPATYRRGGGAAGSEEDDRQDDVIRPSVSQDTQKWVMKLKELDINWVE